MNDKAPFLLVHGMWSRPRVWERIRTHFEAAGRQVLAPALPYHDLTPRDPVPTLLATLGLNDYVNALEEVLADFDQPPVLIGHSMGALLCQLLAARRPPRALVLLSTAAAGNIWSLGWEPLRTAWDIVTTWGYWHRAIMLPPAAALYGVFNNVPADEAAEEISELIHDSGKAFFQIATAFLDMERTARVDYARLTCPALVLVGDDDRITPPSISAATARRLGGPVMYREMPGFGHWIIGRQGTDTVIAHIEAFLARNGL